MLTPPDLDLIRRDPELPGMRLLLEPALLLDKLDSLGLTGVEQLEPIYTRYKPQQSLLTAYRAKTADGFTFLCAKAHREDTCSKLADFRSRLQNRPGGVIERLYTAVYPFQYDRKLTRLSELLDDSARRRLLDANPFIEGDTLLTTLRYKPERRYVAKLEGATGAALVKHYTPAEFSWAAAGVAAFHETENANLAPTVLLSNGQLSVAAWLPGKPLNCLKDDVLGATEATGRALRSLHAQTGKGLVAVGRSTELNRLEDLADTVSMLLPKLEPVVWRLVERLCRRIEVTEPSCVPVHGDFSADQVLVYADSVTILDFDNARLGHPAADVGSFTAQLEWETLTGTRMDVGERLARFGHGYGELPTDTNIYTALALIKLAPMAFRSRRDDWPELTAAILGRAEAYLQCAVLVAA